MARKFSFLAQSVQGRLYYFPLVGFANFIKLSHRPARVFLRLCNRLDRTDANRIDGFRSFILSITKPF